MKNEKFNDNAALHYTETSRYLWSGYYVDVWPFSKNCFLKC